MITLKRKIEKVSFVFHLLSHIYRQPFLFYLIFEPDFSDIKGCFEVLQAQCVLLPEVIVDPWVVGNG